MRSGSAPPLTSPHASFQKKGSRKVHLVRHGESEYNAACGRPGSSWDDPQIFDAPLTDQGRHQAQALGNTLAELLGPRCVWVTSPLTRALQTCVLARQAVGAACPGTWAMPPREAPWVSVRPELSEHLVTCGDVGRPRQALCEAFPDLAAGGAFGQLADVWWFCPPGRPNCCTRRCVSVSETRDQLRARVGAFRKWVLTQPGEELVVFGHSTFFKYFMQGEGMEGSRLKNGEVMTLTL
jgi:broad specificity phosphatase PhoE